MREEEEEKAVIGGDPEPKVIGYVVLFDHGLGRAQELTNNVQDEILMRAACLRAHYVLPTLEQAEEYARRLAWAGGKPARCRIVRVVEQEVARLRFDLSVERDREKT